MRGPARFGSPCSFSHFLTPFSWRYTYLATSGNKIEPRGFLLFTPTFKVANCDLREIMTDSALSTQNILSLIHTIRGQRVILASDLAGLYDVETKRLNEQIKRNLERFPSDFMFQLTADELDALKILRSQFATLRHGQHQKYRPLAFTEHGAIMAANVLNRPQAVAMSVYVIRAFVQQREVLSVN